MYHTLLGVTFAFKIFKMKRNLLLIAAISYFFSGYNQEVRLKIGTEFPLQHYIGVNYQHNLKFSADLSFGIVDSPYNDELYDWIKVPADKKSRKDFLQQTTDDGWVLEFGGNFHKNDWYFGIQGQFIKLNFSESYNEIIKTDLVQNDLASGEKALLDSVLVQARSPLGRLIVDLDDRVEIESSLFQLGLKAGRQFQFKNPKLSMFVELGITANMHTKTKTSYDRNLATTIESFAENQVVGSNSNQILENLDFEKQGEQINQFFEDYGFIPGLSVGVAYRLYKK